MRPTFSSSPWILALLVGSSLLLAACGPAAAAPDLSGLDPAVVLARLAPMSTLDAAAQQVADVLEVRPAQVRVRIRSAGCTVCEAEANQTSASVEGLDVATAAEQVQAGDGVFLFVGAFACAYHFDGAQFNPQSCNHAPL
jgi:hypothetical protein